MSVDFKHLVCAAALTVLAPQAHAATITLTTIADGTVQSFGETQVETSQETLLVTQSPQLERNGIFEFDLSAIDDAATINSVSILFTLGGVNSSTGGTPAAVDLFTYLGDGVIDIDDFDASGTQVVDTTTAVGLPGTTAGVEISFVFSDLSDVTAALLDDLLTVRFETEPSATLRIASLENPEYAAASLTIDYDTAAQVPLPASLPLVLGGLGVLLGVKRRSAQRRKT